MKTFTFLLTIIVASILFSCNSTKYPEYIKKTDSLLASLDSISVKYHEINYGSVKIMFDLVSKNHELIKENESLDLANNQELKQDLFQYGRIHKAFKKYLKEYDKTNSDIEFNKNQLNTFKDDISNNLISEENIIKFYDDELKAHSNLVETINFYNHDVSTSIKLYKEIHTRMSEFLTPSTKNE
ncbi:MAG TPA: hypothetical protein DDX39_11800 [Bacteroidales bacterium]|nr:MAG: hypothetical protein A2W98_10175 [Bacteroidetes bacterium GWF2_33_38]OFY75126.1 MAG: hypothetical protein A2265_03160 [Bacteroidetes bacterium RIFOXYA12_FULL_33_9]HBF89315.1 hypothetical protein [Bacteroidales bacterium]